MAHPARRATIHVAGTPVWTWEAKEPFGSELPNQTVSGTTFTYRGRFPGQVFDPDTGLVHNGFRDYLASVGRYVESDPIGLAGGWNTYGYVGGNPMMGVDLDGLKQVTAFAPTLSQSDQAAYLAQKNLAMAYLSQVPSMAKMINQIDAADYTVTILLTNDTNILNLHAHDEGNGNYSIPWNPYLSPEFYNSTSRTKGFISPALALGHELDHTSCNRTNSVVLGFNRFYNNSVKSFGYKSNSYGNMEEERVITGSERKNATFHHEFTRNNHNFVFGSDGLPVVKNVIKSISH